MSFADAVNSAGSAWFAAGFAETVVIDGAGVPGHIDETDEQSLQYAQYMGVFVSRMTLIVPADAVALPVAGQQMTVNGVRVTVIRAGRDAAAMTIEAVRNAS